MYTVNRIDIGRKMGKYKEHSIKPAKIKNLFVNFVYRFIDFIISGMFFNNWMYFLYFCCYFWYVFPHYCLRYSFQIRFSNW